MINAFCSGSDITLEPSQQGTPVEIVQYLSHFKSGEKKKDNKNILPILLATMSEESGEDTSLATQCHGDHTVSMSVHVMSQPINRG